ncbi:MAG: hypothetical protein GXY41_01075 [Phycisphaerae bacterium]|jgi:hypothetical protein|nr:hypothetical protein [Phycisphaerae bacterium]
MAKKITAATSDVYTAILALASLTVLSTAVYVALKCWMYYGTLFSIAQASR